MLQVNAVLSDLSLKGNTFDAELGAALADWLRVNRKVTRRGTKRG